MDSKREQDGEDRDIEQILRAVGRREQPPDALRESWELAFRDELGHVRSRRRRRRTAFTAGIAASVALIAVLLNLLTLPGTVAPMESRLSYFRGEVNLNGRPVAVDQTLHSGDKLQLAPGAAAALDVAGYDVRLRADSTLTLEPQQLVLERGTLYASSENRQTAIPSLAVATPHGTVRTVGTQFTVTALPDTSFAVVRRGALDIESRASTIRLAATARSARRASLDAGGSIETSEVAARGEDWAWIQGSTPPFELDGSSAYDFLLWHAQELGLDLVFASSSAEMYAKTTTLHGSIDGLAAQTALAPVLATTELAASTVADELHVKLDRSH